MKPNHTSKKFLASENVTVESLDRSKTNRIINHEISEEGSLSGTTSFVASQSGRHSADSAPKNDSMMLNGSIIEG